MRLFAELKRLAQALSRFPGQWAVCGGVAASLYREKARFTDDIDIAVVNSGPVSAEELATQVIRDLGYKAHKGFISENSSQVFAMVCARGTEDDRFVGLDFLLPVQCWVDEAVHYAQKNLIDYGFARLPTITPESLIVAKIVALNSNPERLQDLDDVIEIFKQGGLQKDYIRKQLAIHNVRVPTSISDLLG